MGSFLIPKVPKRWLIAVAGLVWIIAGVNVFLIGRPLLMDHWTSPYLPLLGATVVFCAFYQLIFSRMVKKHNKRIMSFTDDKVRILKFFDTRSYIIMAVMMTLGIVVRRSNIFKPLWVGAFYSGLGAALIAAGLFFLYHFFFDKSVTL